MWQNTAFVMNGGGKKLVLSSCLKYESLYGEGDYERRISEKEMFITKTFLELCMTAVVQL